MDSVTLGFKAGRLTVNLSWWGDFWDYLIAINVDTGEEISWPDSASIELRFYPNAKSKEPEATWPASIENEKATWYIPKTQVIDEVLTPNLAVCRLVYFSPDGREIEWEVGTTRA